MCVGSEQSFRFYSKWLNMPLNSLCFRVRMLDMASARFLTQSFISSRKVLCSLRNRRLQCFKRDYVRTLTTYTQKQGLSHNPPFPYPDIPSETSAKNLVLHLDEHGRSLLLQELTKFEQEKLRLEGK